MSKKNKEKNDQEKNKEVKHFGPRISTLGLLCIFLIGACIAGYPSVSNYLAKNNSIEAIQEYRAYTTSLSAQEIQLQKEAAIVYNENLAGDPVHDPFVPNSGVALPENYTSVLNVAGDGIMGYLDIPSVDIQLLISHGASEEVLEKYVGHIEQTSLPIGGANSHAVLTAHTGLPSAKLFTDLRDVKKGDHFYIYVLDEKLTYEVDQIQVILPEEIEQLRVVHGEDYVTLLTCTPYGINTHRLLVRGKRIPNEEGEVIVRKHTKIPVFAVFLLLLVFLFLFLLIYQWRKKNKENKEKYDEEN